MFIKKLTIGMLAFASILASADTNFYYDNIESKEYEVVLCDEKTISNYSDEYIQMDYDIELPISESIVIPYLCINEYGVPLFPEFQNAENSLSEAAEYFCDEIETLASYYGIPTPLSIENWKQYKICLAEYIGVRKENEIDITNYAKLDVFFDIYENVESNQHLVEMTSSVQSLDDLLLKTDFYYLLPYTKDERVLNELMCSVGIDTCQLREQVSMFSISTSDAVAYAEQYAENPNTAGYGYINGADCTNFVSQIMLVGGKAISTEWCAAQVFGTWHYTSAWANANAFVNYFGLYNTYTSHTSFAANLSRGSFITEDKAGDGDWDHMGFVVAIGGYSSTGYRNYKVAQHTSNYLAWADSDTCGWDTLSNNYPNVVYGRVID